MKFLIAGYGSIGRRHFRNLLALGERDIVLYRTKRGLLSDDELTGFPVESDLQAALAHKPDAVIVANPTALHLDVAIPAAQAGCHLLLEKPVAHSMDRLDILQQAVEKSGSRVLVGFQFRFHPSLMRITRLLSPSLIEAEESLPTIGTPISVRAHWGEYLPAWHPWEDYRQGYSARADLGGGVVLTLCHPLDYLRWMLGEVNSLWAFTGHNSSLEIAVEDTAEIGLRFASGVFGSLHLNYVQRPPAHTLEIIGDAGTLCWDNADGVTRISRAAADGQPGPWETFPAPEGFERNQMFLDETRHFIDVIRGVAPSRCTLQDGIRALRLALAAHESASQGKMITL
ncbi:MAG: Gfo/Idh/MocA family oxidoreductase [Anaerolineales bacterium]|nr:Gfo/Idh/MocA family oxidoreductase [Anaerolineales bacterium]